MDIGLNGSLNGFPNKLTSQKSCTVSRRMHDFVSSINIFCQMKMEISYLLMIWLLQAKFHLIASERIKPLVRSKSLDLNTYDLYTLMWFGLVTDYLIFTIFTGTLPLQTSLKSELWSRCHTWFIIALSHLIHHHDHLKYRADLSDNCSICHRLYLRANNRVLLRIGLKFFSYFRLVNVSL